MFQRTVVSIAVVGWLFAGPVLGQGKPQQMDYTGHKLVEVTMTTPEEVETMLWISHDHWSEGLAVGTFPFRVPGDRMDDLDASGLPYIVLHNNIQEMIETERAGVGLRGSWFDDFKQRAQINAKIDEYVAARPDLVTKLTVGTSVDGRTIYGMKITSSVGGPGKPACLFNGTQHAREWVSPMTVMYIADRLVYDYDTDSDVQEMVDDLVFYIVPIVNPDGFIYSQTVRLWRKNRRNNGDGTIGVDLNRNWPFSWGAGSGSSGDPGNDLYRGPSAASEPETQAMMAFIAARPDIVAHIDFHAYGQLILYPYGHIDNAPPPPEPDNTTFINLSAAMAAAVFDTHGKVYVDKPGWQLYPADGTMPDWTYDEYGILGWTVELRPTSSNPGFILPAAEIIPTAEENFAAVRVLADYVALQLNISPSDLPSILTPDVTTTVDVDIIETSGTLQAGSEKLFARVGTSGAFTESALTSTGGTSYEGTLPAAPCGQVVQYYFQAETTGGATYTSPADAPTSVHEATSLESTIEIDNDMEANQGWTVGAGDDDATTGVWNRMNPQATAAQPEDDHTPSGTDCWVTDGNAGGSLGANDIDGGKTTLFSPVIDMSTMTDPRVSYWRWYSNDTGGAPNADVFTVDISDDNGGSWSNVETVGPAGAGTSGGWFQHEFLVTDFASLTSQVQVRFVAADEGAGSVVEAAVDDFQVIDAGCSDVPCPADVDGDLQITLSDLAVVLANFGTSGATLAQGDVTGDGNVDLSDLAEILAAFGTVCS